MHTELDKTGEMFDPFEPLVDPETGEILEDQTVVVEDIPRIARRIALDRQKIEGRVGTINREISRLEAIRQMYYDKHADREKFLMKLVKDMMGHANKDELEYPGIGKFRYGTTREKVDDSEYMAASDDEKAEIHSSHSNLFVVKTTVRPDKKAIKEAIGDGNPVPGFDLIGKFKKFEFKPE